jgi:hypothetical protein
VTSEPWDADVFRVPDVSWQTLAPPTRHPVPARYVVELDAGDEVTIGLPGHYFVDGQVIARTERQTVTLAGRPGEHEALAVAAPFAYWLAQAFPREGLTMQWWPVDCTWVYRDAVPPGAQPVDGPPADERAGSWLDHVRHTLDEPPVRHPRPARTADALTGRTLRLQHEPGAWSWWVAVSEPIDEDGDILVQVMRPSDYWLTQVAFESADKARAVPLYRLYVYD